MEAKQLLRKNTGGPYWDRTGDPHNVNVFQRGKYTLVSYAINTFHAQIRLLVVSELR